MPNYTPSQVYDKYVALQKQLATNINNKGVTASQNELYDNLIDKVAQIENLKGEEKVLENFTNVLSEPKSIVQLEYPEPKNLTTPQQVYKRAALYSEEIFEDKNCVRITSGTTIENFPIAFKSNTQYTVSFDVKTVLRDKYTTSGTNNVFTFFYDDGTRSVVHDTYTQTDWKRKTLTSTAGKTVASVGIYATEYRSYSYVDVNSFQLEEGSTATEYEPYPAPKTLNAKLGSKNLFDNNNANIIIGYPDAENVINPAPTTRTVYIPCTPNTTYTVSKTVTARFNVAFADVLPASGVTVTGRIQNNTATSITATSTADSKYIVVWVYHSGYDTSITLDEILATLQIELGSVATTYISYVNPTSVNVTRCGKNLIPYPYAYTTQTISGVTFTVNSDGSVTVNGTATANAAFALETDSQMFTLPAADYFLSGCPSGGSASTYLMAAVNGPQIDYDKFLRDFGTGVAVPSSGENWKVSIRIMSGYTANNLVFKPQIELGTTATEYEPYQGQTYTPTATGEVTEITNLYPLTTLLADNAGVLFTEVTGGTYKEILPSTDKNGMTKVLQPSIDSTIDSNITSDNIKQGVSILGVTGDYICNYTYDETTKELVLIL